MRPACEGSSSALRQAVASTVGAHRKAPLLPTKDRNLTIVREIIALTLANAEPIKSVLHLEELSGYSRHDLARAWNDAMGSPGAQLRLAEFVRVAFLLQIVERKALHEGWRHMLARSRARPDRLFRICRKIFRADFQVVSNERFDQLFHFVEGAVTQALSISPADLWQFSPGIPRN